MDLPSNAHLRQHCLHHRPCQPGNRLEGLCHNIAHQSNIAHPRQALWTSSSAWPPSTPSSRCWPSSCTPSPNTAATTRFTSTWLSAGNYFSLPGASVPAASTSPPPPHPHLPHWQRVTTSQQNITVSQTKSGNLGTWGFHKFGNLNNTLKKLLFSQLCNSIRYWHGKVFLNIIPLLCSYFSALIYRLRCRLREKCQINYETGILPIPIHLATRYTTLAVATERCVTVLAPFTHIKVCLSFNFPSMKESFVLLNNGLLYQKEHLSFKSLAYEAPRLNNDIHNHWPGWVNWMKK